MPDPNTKTWQYAEVTSPHIARQVTVIAAKEVTYLPDSNRLQTLNIYIASTEDNVKLIGSPVEAFRPAASNGKSKTPNLLVHIHGGAWRDDKLTAKSIEATVAHTLSSETTPIKAIASINYSVSPFPEVPARMTNTPYDPLRNHHSDRAREAVHPQHVHDVLHGLALLRSYGLIDGSYILSGHSCGACLAFQAILQQPSYYGLNNSLYPPRPAAILGFNGLYDLPSLVERLGSSHEHLRDDYNTFLGIAFGRDKTKWPAVSPACFNMDDVSKGLDKHEAPILVILDQSPDDQLVPMNQVEIMEKYLKKLEILQVVRGHRCTGKHAAPWEEGHMIWETAQDALGLLKK